MATKASSDLISSILDAAISSSPREIGFQWYQQFSKLSNLFVRFIMTTREKKKKILEKAKQTTVCDVAGWKVSIKHVSGEWGRLFVTQFFI